MVVQGKSPNSLLQGQHFTHSGALVPLRSYAQDEVKHLQERRAYVADDSQRLSKEVEKPFFGGLSGLFSPKVRQIAMKKKEPERSSHINQDLISYYKGQSKDMPDVDLATRIEVFKQVIFDFHHTEISYDDLQWFFSCLETEIWELDASTIQDLFFLLFKNPPLLVLASSESTKISSRSSGENDLKLLYEFFKTTEAIQSTTQVKRAGQAYLRTLILFAAFADEMSAEEFDQRLGKVFYEEFKAIQNDDKPAGQDVLIKLYALSEHLSKKEKADLTARLIGLEDYFVSFSELYNTVLSELITEIDLSVILTEFAEQTRAGKSSDAIYVLNYIHNHDTELSHETLVYVLKNLVKYLGHESGRVRRKCEGYLLFYFEKFGAKNKALILKEVALMRQQEKGALILSETKALYDKFLDQMSDEELKDIGLAELMRHQEDADKVREVFDFFKHVLDHIQEPEAFYQNIKDILRLTIDDHDLDLIYQNYLWEKFAAFFQVSFLEEAGIFYKDNQEQCGIVFAEAYFLYQRIKNTGYLESHYDKILKTAHLPEPTAERLFLAFLWGVVSHGPQEDVENFLFTTTFDVFSKEYNQGYEYYKFGYYEDLKLPFSSFIQQHSSHQAAAKYVLELYERHPEDEDVLEKLAWLACLHHVDKSDVLDQAKEIFSQHQINHPESPWGHVVMAYLNHYGRGGVSENQKRAYQFVQKTLERDPENPIALFILGRMYSDYRYGEKDDKRACEYYEKAIKFGNYPAALNNLGLKYKFGEGVKQNVEKAAQLFLQAIELYPYYESPFRNLIGNRFPSFYHGRARQIREKWCLRQKE